MIIFKRRRFYLNSRFKTAVFVVALVLAAAAAIIYGFWRKPLRFPEKSNTEKVLKCEDCNLFVVSLTPTRKDRLGIYGYQKNTSPNIDEFWKNSLIFNNAWAPSSWTLPNAASFFSSLFPASHGIMERESSRRLQSNIRTLAEILKENGYETAAFTGGGDYNLKYGFAQGFDFYLDFRNYQDFNIDVSQFGRANLFYAPLKLTAPLAKKWLEEKSREKFFLFLQGYDPHCPYEPSEPFRSRFTAALKSEIDFSECIFTFGKIKPEFKNGKKYWSAKTKPGSRNVSEVILSEEEDVSFMSALYDAEIAEADFYLKEILDAARNLGLEKNTVFIFMSEHGELLGEHGRFMRGGPLRGTFYEPALNFPLLVRHPAVKERIIIDDLAGTVDLLPTLVDIFGVSDPQKEKRDGKPLRFSAFGDKETNEFVYAASEFVGGKNSLFFSGTNVVEAVRDKEWKLIKETVFENGAADGKTAYELYDIRNDPQESKNLYEKKPDEAQKLKKELEKRFAGFKRRP